MILKREADIPAPIAPPVIIRVHPEEPKIPEAVIIRELPPKVPPHVPSHTITLPGKVLPPVPRKVVVEKLPQAPPPPPKIIVERWLGYPERTRNVIYCQDPQEKIPPPQLPKNVIVEWETPCQEIKQEYKFLGVETQDPGEYILKFGGKLTPALELPKFVSEFHLPTGEVLAINRPEPGTKLVGDVDALKIIDLEKTGLSHYKVQVAVASAGKDCKKVCPSRACNSVQNVVISGAEDKQEVYGGHLNEANQITTYVGDNTIIGYDESGNIIKDIRTLERDARTPYNVFNNLGNNFCGSGDEEKNVFGSSSVYSMSD